MHVLCCKPGQKPVAGEASGHNGEAPDVLLNGHDVSCQNVF